MRLLLPQLAAVSTMSVGAASHIYHMCDAEDLQKQGEMYFPPTYEQDGFVHATENPSDLLGVGNHFYKSAKGSWVCLKLDVTLLNAKVIYESPAPVGNTESHHKEEDAGPLFPHIYGGIPIAAITERFDIQRGPDGSFDSMEGLC